MDVRWPEAGEVQARLGRLLPLVGLEGAGEGGGGSTTTTTPSYSAFASGERLELDFIKSLVVDFQVQFVSALLPDPGLRFAFIAKDGVGSLNRGAAVETLFDVLSGFTLKVFDGGMRESATTHFVFDLAAPVRPNTRLMVDVVVMKITPAVAFTELTLLALAGDDAARHLPTPVAKGTHTKLFLSFAEPPPPPQPHLLLHHQHQHHPDWALLPQPTSQQEAMMMTHHHQLHHHHHQHHHHHHGGFEGPPPPPPPPHMSGGVSLERDGSVHVLIENVSRPPAPHHPHQLHQPQIKRSVMASSGRGRAHPNASRF